jgi:hypothetical protein
LKKGLHTKGPCLFSQEGTQALCRHQNQQDRLNFPYNLKSMNELKAVWLSQLEHKALMAAKQ